MGDILGERMLGANAAGVDGAGLASFGECVITRVEVFAFLEVFG